MGGRRCLTNRCGRRVYCVERGRGAQSGVERPKTATTGRGATRMNSCSRYNRWIVVLAIAGLFVFSTAAQANEQLQKMSDDPNQWVMPGGNYSLTRNSKLDQINPQNAKDLRVAWTMSTGTLRGHEGQPLVIGDMMYFESPYPNYIYPVNLHHTAPIAWNFKPHPN